MCLLQCVGLSGGALFVEATLFVNDAEFRNCSASDRGGAMSVGVSQRYRGVCVNQREGIGLP